MSHSLLARDVPAPIVWRTVFLHSGMTQSQKRNHRHWKHSHYKSHVWNWTQLWETDYKMLITVYMYSINRSITTLTLLQGYSKLTLSTEVGQHLPSSQGHLQVASSVGDELGSVTADASSGKTSWKWAHRITLLPPVSKLCLRNNTNSQHRPLTKAVKLVCFLSYILSTQINTSWRDTAWVTLALKVLRWHRNLANLPRWVDVDAAAWRHLGRAAEQDNYIAVEFWRWCWRQVWAIGYQQWTLSLHLHHSHRQHPWVCKLTHWVNVQVSL